MAAKHQRKVGVGRSLSAFAGELFATGLICDSGCGFGSSRLSRQRAPPMSALRAGEAGRSRQPAKAIVGMGAIATAGILFASAPAWSLGGGSSTNPDYLAMLPVNVRKIVAARCSGSAHPRQYFATYFRNSAEMDLHYDRLSCDRPNRFCTASGCLREVYVLHGGAYRLSRSYYDLR